MRRAQTDKASQLIKNFAYDPSFQATAVSTLLRTNLAINPSLESAGATQAIRTNLLTNPSAETSAGTVNVRTNLATNPSFAGASGVTNVLTNLNPYPSFETAGATTNVRTNLCMNPNVESNASRYAVNVGAGGAATGAQATSGGMFGPGFYRATWTTAPTSGGYLEYSLVSAGLVTAGTVYTFSGYVRSSAALTITPKVTWAIGSTSNGASTGSPVVLTPNTWTRISHTTTASTAGTDGAWFDWTVTAGTISVGTTIDLDGVLIEASPVLGPYFDGSIPAIENLAKTAPSSLNGTTQTTGVSYAGSTWTRATAPINGSNNIVRQYAALADLRIGERYTTYVTVANDQAFAQSITLDWCDTNYLNVTLQPGETRRISTYSTFTSYDATFRFSDIFVSSSATEARSVLFKDWLIEIGNGLGSYYSGTGDFTYAWSGTAQASTSYQQAPSVAGYIGTVSGVPYQSSLSPMTGTKCAAVTTKGGNGDGILCNNQTVTAGRSYTWSAWVKTSTAHSLSGLMRWIDAGSVIISDTTVDVTSQIVVGSWSRVTMTAIAPANTATIQPMWRIFAAHTPTTFYVDGSLIVQSGVDVPYFDGSTAASGDFTYAWAGTPNASQSYQQAPTITTWLNRWFGATGGAGALYQAKGGISGTYARKLWNNANTGAAMDTGINTPNTAVLPSTTYTLSMWVRSSVAQVMNPYIDWKDSGSVFISSTTQGAGFTLTPNTWTRISVTATSPSTAAFGVFTLTPYNGAIAMPAGATLDFDHVLIEAAAGLQDYFDGANPIKNFAVNPNVEVNIDGWATNDGTLYPIVRSTVSPIRGTASILATRDATGLNSSAASIWTNGINSADLLAQKVSPGEIISFSLDVRVYQTNRKATTYFAFRNASGGVVGTSTAVTTNLTAGVTTRVGCAGVVVPAGSDSILCVTNVSSVDGSNAVSGEQTWFDGLLIERSATLNPYYEGTGDFSYVWGGTGVANANISYQQASGVSGAGGVSYLGWAYQSGVAGVTSGNKAIRITPTSPSNGDSFVEVNSMLAGYTFKANTTYTISGNRTILAPQTNINGTTHFRINIGSTELTPTLVSPVLNVAGTQRVVARFTTGSGTNLLFVRFYNGSYFGGGDVWWDDIMLEEGTTNGKYFDGSNPIQNLCTNPSFATNISGWTTVSASLTRVTNQGGDGHAGELAQTIAGGVRNTARLLLTGGIGTYNISFDMKGTDSSFTNVRCFLYDSATAQIVSGSLTTPLIKDGNFNRYSFTLTATGTFDNIYMEVQGTAIPLGTKSWLDRVLVEKTTNPSPYYYEGTGDFVYAWNGTANASMSEQRANFVGDRIGVTANAGVYQSAIKAYSGAKSGAIFTRNQIFSDGTLMYPSADYWSGTGTGYLTAGIKNTWSMWVWVPSGSGTVFLKEINTNTSGAPNTLFDQWERISVTFTPAANAQHVMRLRAWTTVPAGTTIWWDNELIEAAPSVGPYFDGSAITPDMINAWTGTANASISTQSVLVIPNTSNNRNTAIVDSRFHKYQATSEEGKKIARWVAPAGSANSAWRIAGIPPTGFDFSSLKAGGVYTLFFRWRSSGWIAANQMQVAIQDATAQNPVIGFDSGNALNQTGWVEYRRTFTALRDATSASMLYISLPVTPHATTDGIFDMRDWMIVEGDYKGDYVDGTKPLSKWTGTANASISIGFPPQFLDIAGKPTADLFTTSSQIWSPDVAVDGFAPRTFYVVYEVTDINQASWQVPFNYGTTPSSEGFTFQTNAAGVNQMVPRGDFTTGVGGAGNLTHAISNSRVSGRVYVASFAFPQGLTQCSWMLNGTNNESIRTYTPSSVGWTRSIARLYTQLPGIKGIRALTFEGVAHSTATRADMMRYLGNKYGANVA